MPLVLQHNLQCQQVRKWILERHAIAHTQGSATKQRCESPKARARHAIVVREVYYKDKPRTPYPVLPVCRRTSKHKISMSVAIDVGCKGHLAECCPIDMRLKHNGSVRGKTPFSGTKEDVALEFGQAYGEFDEGCG